MTGADTYLTHALFRAIYIYYILHYIIRDHAEIAFGKRHDPGQITYLTQKTVLLLKTKRQIDKKLC